MRAEYKTFWLGRRETFTPKSPYTGNFVRDVKADWQALLSRAWRYYNVGTARLIMSDIKDDLVG